MRRPSFPPQPDYTKCGINPGNKTVVKRSKELSVFKKKILQSQKEVKLEESLLVQKVNLNMYKFTVYSLLKFNKG